ncbi:MULTISPECIES: maleylpyruvate isomerase family mycothiol-dependent enzyme [Pseudonocardia]|uniref:maleylpyruvate isomerase family mycothiol-dependent enzyme n=1 Tax=Pseudonocardia TaxID=1847 RepID=UPI001E3BC884|nr:MULTISPECIES: maleylpyruvate isomerase family mycothiol-dependent enzyme [Pseudonocardia]
MTTPTVPRAAIDRAVSAERVAVADLVDSLTDDEWITGSLCSGWTVRDVVAHLTTTTRAPGSRPVRRAPAGRRPPARPGARVAARGGRCGARGWCRPIPGGPSETARSCAGPTRSYCSSPRDGRPGSPG